MKGVMTENAVMLSPRISIVDKSLCAHPFECTS